MAIQFNQLQISVPLLRSHLDNFITLWSFCWKLLFWCYIRDFLLKLSHYGSNFQRLIKLIERATHFYICWLQTKYIEIIISTPIFPRFLWGPLAASRGEMRGWCKVWEVKPSVNKLWWDRVKCQNLLTSNCNLRHTRLPGVWTQCVPGDQRLRGHQGSTTPVADKQWPEPETPWETEQIETLSTEPEGARPCDHVGYRSTFIQMAPLNHQFYHFGQYWFAWKLWLDCELCAGAQCAGAGGRADAGVGPRPHERPDAAGGDQVRHPRPPPAVRHGHGQHNHPQPDRWDQGDYPLYWGVTDVFSGILMIVLSSVFTLPSFLGYVGSSNYIRPCLVLVKWEIFSVRKREKYFVIVPGSTNYSLDNGAGPPDSLPWCQTICHGRAPAPSPG